MKIRVALACIIALASHAGFSQSRLMKDADALYNQYRFREAIEKYKKVVDKKDEESFYAIQQIANSFRLMGEYVAAQPWYKKAVRYPNADPVLYFRYGRALCADKQYDSAMVWFAKFIAARPDDARAKALKSFTMPALNNLLEAEQYSVFPLAVNTEYDEFSTSFYGTKVIYVSNRVADGKLVTRKHSWDQQAFLDLFVADVDDRGQLVDPNPLEDLNHDYHEGPVCVTKDLQRIYYTGNSLQKGKLVKGSNETTHLMIYGAYRSFDNKQMGWTKPEPLPFNSPEFSCMHPTIGPMGKVMIFASDMAGGQGGMDLYLVEYGVTGWGVPRNLGPQINGPGDEVFPFLAEDGDLYFSSNSWPGLGGLDVFKSKGTSDRKFGPPQNLGAPINQELDDFGFVLNGSGKFGYLSSNRPNGRGRDDLYYFQVNGAVEEPLPEAPVVNQGVKQLEVEVYESPSGKGLSNAVVNIFNQQGKMIQAIQVNDTGFFSLDFDDRFTGDLRFIASYGDYSPQREIVNMEKLMLQQRSLVRIPLSKDLGKQLNLNPIYFDYNKDNIRPDAARELDKVVAVMLSNPDLVIELGSHTDSRGKNDYNQALSERRAASSVAYIISRGVSPQRIRGRGFGESQLTNQCEDGVVCSEVDHQLNRRTEFRIVSGSLKNF